MKKKALLIPLVAAIGLALGPEAGAQPAPAGSTVQASAPVWLGVAIGPVPQAVQAQLPDGTEKNQGLMVRRVMRGSPAEAAGIRRHDVLLSYNGEKLFSPRDLVERVRSAKPDEKVTLEVVRHGKPMKVEVTLESRHASAPLRRPSTPRFESRSWESFQSMSVVKNPDGKYSAVVEFLDDSGNKKRFEYEGTRDEISAQVRKERELPAPLKRQLLDALSDRMPEFPPMEIPAFRDFPRFPGFNNDDFFAPPPWWNQGRRGFWD